MPNRNVILAVAFLAATVFPAQFDQASAEIVVKTKAQCTRYGGRVSRNTGSMRATHPWACATPAKDRQCVKKHGKGWYFDAEFGKCVSMAEDELDCYIF